jgi:DNA-binding response OmpR family regulator
MRQGAARFQVPVVIATAEVPADPRALVFDVRHFHVYRGGRAWALAPGPFRLLLIFAVNQGRHLSLQELTDHYLVDDPEGGADTADKCTYVKMWKLRRRIVNLGLSINMVNFGRYELCEAAAFQVAA